MSFPSVNLRDYWSPPAPRPASVRRQTWDTSLVSVPFARVTTVKAGTFTRLPTQVNALIRQNP